MFFIRASSAAVLTAATPLHSAEIDHASNAPTVSHGTESREVGSRLANHSRAVAQYAAAQSAHATAVARHYDAMLASEPDDIHALSGKGDVPGG